MVWGAAITAGASLAGSLLSKKSADNQHDAQMYVSGESLKLQREAAQQGIRWRVADAKAAGIHPLYALGAQISSPAGASYIPSGSDGGGNLLAQAGQDIGRAVDAARTAGERNQPKVEALTVRRLELENDLLSARIAKERAQLGPPLPMPGVNTFMPGQGDPERLGLTVGSAQNHVEQKPMEVTVPNPRMTNQEPSAVADLGFAWTGSGYAPVPSKDVKERMEDVTIPQLMWGWRNNVLPNIPGQGKPPPAHLIPEGFNNWRWSYSKQEWQPHFDPHRARIPVRRGMHGPDRP